MTSTSSATPKASISEAQLQQMAAEILQEIPGAEVDNCAGIGVLPQLRMAVCPTCIAQL